MKWSPRPKPPAPNHGDIRDSDGRVFTSADGGRWVTPEDFAAGIVPPLSGICRGPTSPIHG